MDWELLRSIVVTSAGVYLMVRELRTHLAGRSSRLQLAGGLLLGVAVAVLGPALRSPRGGPVVVACMVVLLAGVLVLMRRADRLLHHARRRHESAGGR